MMALSTSTAAGVVLPFDQIQLLPEIEFDLITTRNENTDMSFSPSIEPLMSLHSVPHLSTGVYHGPTTVNKCNLIPNEIHICPTPNNKTIGRVIDLAYQGNLLFAGYSTGELIAFDAQGFGKIRSFCKHRKTLRLPEFTPICPIAI